ncbi:hypothetical protein J6590_029175 [Homalodisca vitripennis]|nr:hypothetical protein J6590_029175 [Homalodisca vitripennis]
MSGESRGVTQVTSVAPATSTSHATPVLHRVQIFMEWNGPVNISNHIPPRTVLLAISILIVLFHVCYVFFFSYPCHFTFMRPTRLRVDVPSRWLIARSASTFHHSAINWLHRLSIHVYFSSPYKRWIDLRFLHTHGQFSCLWMKNDLKETQFFRNTNRLRYSSPSTDHSKVNNNCGLVAVKDVEQVVTADAAARVGEDEDVDVDVAGCPGDKEAHLSRQPRSSIHRDRV